MIDTLIKKYKRKIVESEEATRSLTNIIPLQRRAVQRNLVVRRRGVYQRTIIPLYEEILKDLQAIKDN